MASVPTHIKIQNEFNGIQQQHPIENVNVEKSKYNVWNLTFIIEDQSYFGKIIFPRNYPVQAPSIQICTTPNLKEPKKFLYLPIIENWKASCTAKEVIHATLNVMKELDQHSNLFYSIPALNGLQIDIFRDILKFLDGPNIENCSLVSRSWENVIRIYRKILPLRKIYALVIHQEYDTDNLVVRIFHKIRPRNMHCESYYNKYGKELVNYSCELGEELVKIPDFYKTPEKKMKKISSIHIPEINHVKISALQNCIFDEIVLNFSKFSQIWQANYSVDLFGKLVEICGQKIKTIHLDDENNNNLIAYASSLYPKIFNYVDADRLDKYVLKEVDSIVSNPDYLFTIPNPPTHITLSCEANVDFLFDISVGIGVVNLIKIFDCLIQSQRDLSRYSLLSSLSDFCPVLDTFCEKVLSAFESTSEPGNLPPQIKIYIGRGGNYDQFLQRLFDRSGNLDKKRIKHKNAKGVKFQRSDQWKITFGLDLYQKQDETETLHAKAEIVMPSVPAHIKIQPEFNEIKANSIENVVVEKSKYNVWNLTFIVEDQPYFGKIIFPRNYPVQAPSIQICTTPNLKEPKKFLYLPIIENWKATCTAKEVIQATLNVMKELDQHSNLFYSIPALNGLQIDIFRDILKFLDGPNIENCSLVSRSWENFIRIYRKILPLRKIYALVIHQEDPTDLVVRIFHKICPRYMDRESYFYNSKHVGEELVKIPHFYKTPEKEMKMDNKISIHIPEDNYVKISALQNCIFDEIVLNFSKFSQIWQVNYSVDLFAKLVEICGQKLKTIRLDDEKSEKLIAYTSSLYPKIFNYVDADRLDKNVLKEVDSIVSNPNCLFTIPNPPTHITLSCKNDVDLIKIFDCLIQSQTDVSRYSLLSNMSDFCPVLDTFCEKVLSAFESTSEPGNLPSQIKIYISRGTNYDQFLQRLFDRSGNLDKNRIKQGFAKGVKFQRSDQWKITFELNLYYRYPDEPNTRRASELRIKIINP